MGNRLATIDVAETCGEGAAVPSFLWRMLDPHLRYVTWAEVYLRTN